MIRRPTCMLLIRRTHDKVRADRRPTLTLTSTSIYIDHSRDLRESNSWSNSHHDKPIKQLYHRSPRRVTHSSRPRSHLTIDPSKSRAFPACSWCANHDDTITTSVNSLSFSLSLESLGEQPTCMLLVAWQKIPARSSEVSVYLVQDYDRAHDRSPRASNCDWIRPRARQDRVLRLAGVASPAQPRRKGWKARWKPRGGGGGLFSPCRSRVRVVVGL